MESQKIFTLGIGCCYTNGHWYLQTSDGPDGEGVGESFHQNLDEVRAELIAQVIAMIDSVKAHQ